LPQPFREKDLNRIIVSLGSNVDKEMNLPLAIRLLGKRCPVKAVSSIYETAAVGLTEQPNYLNAAVLIETELTPSQLKAEVLVPLEEALKRERTADKNAPRTIDADVVLCNEDVFEYGSEDGRQHHLPDPDLLRFPHVIVPVAELLPDMLHPETGEPLAWIARRLTSKALQADGRPSLWKRPDITWKR
jgi:2-amino-4-hydroxy-6-hydroxymethyldihydropteridine diphosphokinase